MGDEVNPSSYDKEQEIRIAALNIVNEVENSITSSEDHESLKRETLLNKHDKFLTIAADGIEMMEPQYPQAEKCSEPSKLKTIVECENVPLENTLKVEEIGSETDKISDTDNVFSSQVYLELRRDSASNSLAEEAPPSPGSSDRTKRPQLTRTQTLPNPKTSQFGIKFTKKKSSSKKSSDECATTEQNKTSKPFSSVFRSIRKSITKNRFSKGEQSRSSIPQKTSSSGPSPRIVSSLVITPTEGKPSDNSNGTNDEQLTPITQKRRLMEEITDDLLHAMPSSPVSINSYPEESMGIIPVGASVQLAAANNADQTSTLTNPVQTELVLETAITPVSLGKPVHAAFNQAITVDHGGVLTGGKQKVFVSGQPPAETDTEGRSEAHTVSYPPPRPHAPPNVLRRMQTLSPQISRPESCMSPTESHRVSSPPMTLSPATLNYNTASLDRRKIYRSKTETNTIKRSTIARPPLSRNSTIYRPLSTIESGTSAEKQKPPIVMFERSEAIAWPPKFFRKRGTRTLSHEHDLTNSEASGSRPMLNQKQFSISNGPAVSTFHPCLPVSSIRGLDHSSVTLLQGSILASSHAQGRSPKPTIQQYTRPHEKLRNLPTYQELILPLLNSRLEHEKRLFCAENEDASLNETQRSILLLHPFLKSFQAPEGGTENVPMRDCISSSMKNYITTCMRLRESEIRGECAAFHCITGDLLGAGWTQLGYPRGWPSIHVLMDPASETQFALLPHITYGIGSEIYPDVTLDCMLVNWLDIASTIHLTEASTNFDSKQPDLEFLHPASAIISLNDFLQQFNESLNSPNSVRLCIGLAVLLSLNCCHKRMEEFSSQNSNMNLAIDYSPQHILLLASPANCLPVFHLQSAPQSSTSIPEQEDGSQNLQQLISSFGLKSCSLETAIKETLEGLTKVSSCNANVELLLPNLLKAMLPPDWIALSICRISIV